MFAYSDGFAVVRDRVTTKSGLFYQCIGHGKLELLHTHKT